MRLLFENGQITEAMFNDDQVRVTMTKNKCFDIRKFDSSLGYYPACFETTSKCDWETVKRYVNSLITE